MDCHKTDKENPMISIQPPPLDLVHAHELLFSKECLKFLVELVTAFNQQVDQLLWKRLQKKSEIQTTNKLPEFAQTSQRLDQSWRVKPVPQRLQNRRLDLGDVSPANTQHFINALRADVQGIQVDFDDGHCPTWRNQILGLYNVYQAVHGEFYGVKSIEQLPILMLRPRAWNMIEHNIMINGQKAPGPLIDFGILMFLNAKILTQAGAGPYFYLSKLECASEAKLWNDIFVWTQKKLGIPQGTIKACVLIENILASFEMEEILFELKDHSLGLNCGIWDYAASIINKFGHNIKFLLPDRNKYVNMQRHFLSKYMELVVQTCHRRGAHATGGMSAILIQNDSKNYTEKVEQTIQAKKLEILAGVDGFMVYDLELVPYINQLWNDTCGKNVNQLHIIPNNTILTTDLLLMPSGGVTMAGLKHNTEVAILFIYQWLKGNGHFYYKGSVEDSATAEISRSQIWQWIKHQAIIEDSNLRVTKNLVQNLAWEFLRMKPNCRELILSSELFMEIITARIFPDFITTFLNDNHIFQHEHANTKEQLKTKL